MIALLIAILALSLINLTFITLAWYDITEIRRGHYDPPKPEVVQEDEPLNRAEEPWC